MKNGLSEEGCEKKEEHTIPVKYRGWGAPTVRVWLTLKDFFAQTVSEGFVIWNTECVSDLVWAPGSYDIYKVYLEKPDKYTGQKEAKEDHYDSCRVEYYAVRRESPVPEPEEYEKLLYDFRPYLSHKHYEELLRELEGKTPEEKEELIKEEMDELTAMMSYY